MLTFCWPAALPFDSSRSSHTLSKRPFHVYGRIASISPVHKLPGKPGFFFVKLIPATTKGEHFASQSHPHLPSSPPFVVLVFHGDPLLFWRRLLQVNAEYLFSDVVYAVMFRGQAGKERRVLSATSASSNPFEWSPKTGTLSPMSLAIPLEQVPTDWLPPPVSFSSSYTAQHPAANPSLLSALASVLVSYEGHITKVVSADAAVFELDNVVLLYLAHQPLTSYGRGLRVGCKVLLQNAHVTFANGGTLRTGFALCSDASLTILEFSTLNTPYEPVIPQLSEYFPFAKQCSIMDYCWVSTSLWSLQEKFASAARRAGTRANWSVFSLLDKLIKSLHWPPLARDVYEEVCESHARHTCRAWFPRNTTGVYPAVESLAAVQSRIDKLASEKMASEASRSKTPWLNGWKAFSFSEKDLGSNVLLVGRIEAATSLTGLQNPPQRSDGRTCTLFPYTLALSDDTGSICCLIRDAGSSHLHHVYAVSQFTAVVEVSSGDRKHTLELNAENVIASMVNSSSLFASFQAESKHVQPAPARLAYIVFSAEDTHCLSGSSAAGVDTSSVLPAAPAAASTASLARTVTACTESSTLTFRALILAREERQWNGPLHASSPAGDGEQSPSSAHRSLLKGRMLCLRMQELPLSDARGAPSSSFYFYYDQSKLGYRLGLIPGAHVTVTNAARRVSRKTGNVYLASLASTAICIDSVPSLESKSEGASPGLTCKSSGGTTQPAPVRLASVAGTAPRVRLIDLVTSRSSDRLFAFVLGYCSITQVRFVRVQWVCSNCGQTVVRSRCGSSCDGSPRQAMSCLLKCIVSDGTGEAVLHFFDDLAVAALGATGSEVAALRGQCTVSGRVVYSAGESDALPDGEKDDASDAEDEGVDESESDRAEDEDEDEDEAMQQSSERLLRSIIHRACTARRLTITARRYAARSTARALPETRSLMLHGGAAFTTFVHSRIYLRATDVREVDSAEMCRAMLHAL